MTATPKVLLKRSSVVGKVPVDSDLDYGELAINFADGKIYYKNSSNQIQAFVDSARVAAIAEAVEVVAQAQLDSAEVTSLIDSSYVQALIPESYLATIIDSSYINARSNHYTTANHDSDFEIKFATKSTTNLPEGTNLYYTKARADSDIAASLNDSGNTVSITINNTIEDKVDSAYVLARVQEAPFLDSTDAIQLIDSAYIQARQVDLQRDSGFVKNIIDSAYIQARENNPTVLDSADILLIADSDYIKTVTGIDADKLDGQHGNYYRDYNNFTNTPVILDLTDISTQITADVDKAFVDALNVDADTLDGQNGTHYLDYTNFTNTPALIDSSLTAQLIDSAYIQLRDTPQDFAYASLTGTPTIPSFGNDYIDSQTVLDIITREGLDSDLVISLVDSAYIALRDRFQDSSLVTSTVDSSYIQIRIPESYLETIIDSAYIETRRPAETIFNVVNSGSSAYTFTGDGFSSGVNNPTLYLQRGKTYKFNVNASSHPFQIRVSNGGAAYSTGVTNNGQNNGVLLFTPDMSAPNTLVYQCTIHGGMVGDIVIINNNSFLDSSSVTSVITQSYVTSLNIDADLLDGQTGSFYLDYNNFSNTPTIPTLGNDFIDSTQATLIIDSAYVQARQTTGGSGTVDSADIIAIVDSAYVQARQTSGGGGGGGTDSATVSTIIINDVDSAYIQARQLNETAAELTQTTYSFSADSGQTSFTGIDIDSGKFQVYLNGLLLPRADYTHNSSKVDLLVAADSADVLEVIKFSGNTGANVPLTQTFYEFTADSGQTVFTGADDNAETLSFSDNKVAVYLNGILLAGDDYALSAGNRVTLTSAADSGNLLTVSKLSGNNIGIDSDEVRDLIDSAYIQARQSSVGSGGIDSADIINLVDSAYIQARQTTGGGGTGTVDSAYVLSVVDSAVVPFSQTFYHFTADSGQIAFSGFDDDSDTLAYTTGALAVYLNGILLVDSVDYTASNGTSIILADSAAVGDVLSILKFGGNTTGIDSADVINLIDSAYINARVNPFDSSHVLSLVDSAYIQLRDRFQDSSGILSIVDSDYVKLRVTKSDLDMEGNKVLFANVYSALGDLPSATTYHGMFAHVHATGAGYFAHAGNWIRLASLSEVGLDSSAVISVIDSNYVQARTTAGTDSAATIALITSTVDSAYVALREANSGGGSGLDSAAIITLIDSAYVTARAPAGGGGGGGGIDSAAVITLIDSAYIGTKVDFTRGEFVNEKSQYTATAAQTVFSHSSIDPTHLDVYLNGVLQVVNDDYTATSSAVTFTSGVDSGYSVTIVEKRGRVLTQRGLVESKYYFTTPTPTTSITGADDNSNTLDYSDGFLDVYLNGILLKDSDDYSTNAGTTVTLVSATDSNDLVTLINRKGVVVTPNVKNYEFTATAGQTSFSGSDVNSNTLSYVPGALQVHLNGILLRNTDFTATTGSSITLVDSASLNDELVVSAFSNPGQNMDLYKFTADSGQTIFSGNDLTGASLAYQPGNIQVFMNGLLLNDSDDYIASNGMSVVLTSGADASDEIKIASFVSNTDVIRTNAWTAPSGTPVTAAAGDKLFIDTSSAKTITLPVAASLGDEIRIIDVTGNAATNNITVARNGHKIQGAASDLTINVDRAGIGLVYYNAAQGWVLIEN